MISMPRRLCFFLTPALGSPHSPLAQSCLTRQPDWRRFAVSDGGCGMRLLRSHLRPDDFSIAAWETLADALRQNKGGLGDLGGGNHFLDALAPYSDDRLQLLIHTGSRAESDHVEAFVDKPVSVDAEFNRVVEWATANRAAIHKAVEEVLCCPGAL